MNPSSNVHDLMYGINQKCRAPCLTTSVNSKKICELSTPGSTTSTFEVPGTLKRTEEKFMNMDMNVLVSLAGGNLGLWLGSSILSISNRICIYFKNKMQKPNHSDHKIGKFSTKT